MNRDRRLLLAAGAASLLPACATTADAPPKMGELGIYSAGAGSAFLPYAQGLAAFLGTQGLPSRALESSGSIENMRKVDAEPIRTAIDAARSQSVGRTAAHKRIEAWRERLLANDAALMELLRAFPQADIQRLGELIRGTAHEREAHQPPHNYRELYQALRALIEPRVTNKGDD